MFMATLTRSPFYLTGQERTGAAGVPAYGKTGKRTLIDGGYRFHVNSRVGYDVPTGLIYPCVPGKYWPSSAEVRPGKK